MPDELRKRSVFRNEQLQYAITIAESPNTKIVEERADREVRQFVRSKIEILHLLEERLAAVLSMPYPTEPTPVLTGWIQRKQ